MQFHFHQELSEKQRQAEIEEMTQMGNHKSAQENDEEVNRLLEKDVYNMASHCRLTQQSFKT
jgi:hypothetical protein